MSEIILQKSSRLQAMRAAAIGTKPEAAPVKAVQIAVSNDKKLSPELLLARQLIDQRLAELVANLPVGKQQGLFKIRFGMTPEQIKQLTLKQIFSKLAINPAQIKQLSTNPQAIWELNYNGEQSTHSADQ